MRKGGQEVLRKMSVPEYEAFKQANKGWIIGRDRARRAIEQSRAAARNREKMRTARYQRARPETRALYNRVMEARALNAARLP